MKFVVFALISCLGLGALGVLAEDDKIRQCTCDEMDQCWKSMHEDMKPCTEACKEKLTAPGLDPEEGKKCFEYKHDKKSSCHKELQKKMCAADENTFINKNETWQGHHKVKKDVENSLEEESVSPKKLAGGFRHHHGHHRGRFGFFHFIKVNFGESGKEFKRCMRTCFKSKKHGCIKDLGCGIKKLSREEFKSQHETCRGQREEKKQELCECLSKAGMKEVKCDFGKKSN
ncbi:hypothetical protein FO519_007828 [Halicephalobus sp. NKZ332]|nr:hypothetical protein FO519_007828 [Halicephalobus sp. NKZ332]